MLEFSLIENSTPKYQQIIDSVINAIDKGKLALGDRIPSLNRMMQEHHLSQDTVLSAYNHLKSTGIISSQVGKGYYIASLQTSKTEKIFLLFDNFTMYKEDLYNTIVSEIEGKGSVELFFHHNKPEIYRQLIENAVGAYSAYVIMPILGPESEYFLKNTLRGKNVFILDQSNENLRRSYSFLCQDFRNDAYRSLKTELKILKKYTRIRYVSQSDKVHFGEIGSGLKRFAAEKGFRFETISDIQRIIIKKGDLFILVRDLDLVILIEKIDENNFEIGKDVGCISYNETKLKKVIAYGITTISTDFAEMGRRISTMIMNKESGKYFNKTGLIVRNSI